MKSHSLVYVFFILTTFSCTIKNELGPEYPPIGNSGAGAIAYSANGRHLYAGPHEKGDGSGLPVGPLRISNNILSIETAAWTIGTQENHQIEFQINNFNGKGNYSIGGLSTNSADYDFVYYTDTLHTGLFSVTTFDTIQRIVSGTFYFNSKYTVSNVEMNITNGQFDLKY